MAEMVGSELALGQFPDLHSNKKSAKALEMKETSKEFRDLGGKFRLSHWSFLKAPLK